MTHLKEIIADPDECQLEGCCAVDVVYELVHDSDFGESDFRGISKTRLKKELVEVADEYLKAWRTVGKKGVMKYRTTMATVLVKDQSMMLAAFKTLKRTKKLNITFTPFKSRDGKRDLMLIFFRP